MSNYLERRRREIDDALQQAMPGAETRPAALHRAMRYAVFPGGKRLRPAFCLAAAEALGAPTACALAPAVAVELLHAYTLVHDDLPCMDDDRTRRGKPTVHVAFGEALAVLAGDALQTLAFECLAAAPHTPSAVAVQWVAELARAAGSRGVVGGQVEDIAAIDGSPDVATIDFIHARKTADLFRAALRMGAIGAQAAADDLAALSDYGFHIGVAFQVADDLLDDAETNAPSVPERAQEASCLQVMDRAAARAKASALVRQALAALERFPAERVAPLVDIARRIEQRAQGTPS